MALSKDRNTKRRDGKTFSDPVAAAAVIFAGGLVAINATGFLEAASATAANVTRGVAQTGVDNTNGNDGDVSIESLRGVFQFKNSADADLIDRTMIGSSCYVVDDETVAATSATASRPVAGVVRDVDDGGVWVEIA